MTGPANRSPETRQARAHAARRFAAALFVLAGLVGGGLGGCASNTPRFELLSAEQAERTTDAVRLNFLLEAVNPGEAEIPLRTARYRLVVGGETVFEGRRAPAVSVRGQGRQPFELPAVVTAEDFDVSVFDQPGAEIPYRLVGTIEYQVPGELAEVLFDTGVRRPRAPLRAEGVFVIEDDRG